MGIFAPDGKLAAFLNGLGSLIVLNILTLICCLPVVTAGAALCALFTMTMRMVRKEDGKIIKEYFAAFRQNFKKSTIVWLAGIFLTAFMAFDIYILSGMEGKWMLIYRIVLLVLIVILGIILLYYLMLQARFENTIRETLKNAVILAVVKHILSILMLAVMFAPFLLYMVSLRFLSVGFLLGISGPAYLISIFFVSVFRSLEPKTEDEEETEE
ncbi:MAG: DUF624 domain-containing protein [Eubacteriales bacterium]|nr:DUF624 domain-containing protein [Eubacteriales bacterium]